MNVEVFDTQRSLLVSKERVVHVVETTLDFLKISTDCIAVHLVSKKRIKELHKQLFNDPSITDCITQPFDPPKSKKNPHFLGEVFICPWVAKTYANSNELDPYEELTLYVIHTILHLSGLEDTTPGKAAKMRVAEKKVLEHLKSKNVHLK
ncbi:MAG: rRNA maturation RNase YbeY [Chlamydiae bacterium]|nr:rRNA maturation RNase YbeY [Chlamydiota bacterium]